MDMRGIVLAIGVISLFTNTDGQLNTLSNVVQLYSFGIPEAYSRIRIITLYISSEVTAMVQVEAPFVQLNVTHVIKETTRELTLDPRLELTGSGLSKKGVIIKSDARISVHVLITETDSSDGFLAKPLGTHATEFYVFTYTKTSRANEFVISVPNDNTEIRIVIKLSSGYVVFEGHSYSNRQTIRKVLNKYDTLQLQSAGDLTGTYINSTKPIAVQSGNKCMTINGACDVTVDQLLPVIEWKTEYITSKLEADGSAILRIMASKDKTVLQINNQAVTSLNKGVYYEKRMSSAEIVSIKGSEPIAVVQFYDLLDAGVTADPFMVTVPSIDQFLTSYTFEVPTTYRSNYLVVYIEANKTGGVLLDGRAPRITYQRTIDLADSGLVFGAGRIAVTTGKHKLTHATPGTRFGALLYGLKSAASYGFFLGYSNGPVCTPPCSNNGTCIAGNTCHCPLGYRGQRCELGAALANELKPRLFTLIDGNDNNFMDSLAWYADPPISDSNKACYIKLLVQNSTIDTIGTAISSTTDDVVYGNFTAGPIDSTAGVTGHTRFACLEVRCPFVTMTGVLSNTVVKVSLDGNNTETCRVRNHNEHVTNFTVQSESGKSDEIQFVLEVGKNYGPYYGVYMAIGNRDKAKFLGEHKCNSGHEYDYESYNPNIGVLAEYVC